MQVLIGLISLMGDSPGLACELIRPVAPDEQSARRIAKAVVQNVPPSRLARQAREAGRPYELIIELARDDPTKWLAFESPQPDPTPLPEGVIELHFAGHGLSFRIDRCTGAVSRMHFQR